ncbi:MAG: ABC transporter ATP-binding protein [Deltaproteobacteria bacterium]|nr:ABC transporter ATP-binding protein [Deltaproteobacteria bacterium]
MVASKVEDPIVRVRQVSKSYGGDQRTPTVTALSDINLDVMKGEFLALSGPSGSGKTTLLNLIGALDVPTNGTIMIENCMLGQMKRSELSLLRRNRIGFVFQAYNLIPIMTALENAEFTLALQRRPKHERIALAMQALKQVGLGDFASRLPRELSGGQQQRVAIARAIAPQPALILADEPTANLDSKSAISLLDIMQDLNARLGVTFIFSTHDPRVIERARRIVPMVDGRIVA